MDSAAPALPPCYRISPRDDVAIALRDLTAGERVALDDAAIELLDAIPRSHKFALRSVNLGEPVRKYGQVIGRATTQIARGAHVHTHNLATLLSGVNEYRFGPRSDRTTAPTAEPLTFMGYRRADGRVGTRNEIWILCTVGCVGRTAERIARLAADRCKGRVDGVYAFPHQFGCSQLGGDLERTRKLIAALARHPNAGGVLILGLGCESNQLDPLLQEIPQSQRAHIRTFAAQATSDEVEEGLRLVEELADMAARADGELANGGSLSVERGRDLVQRNTKHVMEEEGRPLQR